MTSQDLWVKEKKEQLQEKGETTEVGRYFVPLTDIHESDDALFITMDMPGVRKENVNIHLEKDVLTVTGNIDFSNYGDLTPVYTEYSVGNFIRSFTLSRKINKDGISAKMADGVLTLYLPKMEEVASIKIEVQ